MRQQLEAVLPELSKSEARVARYLLNNEASLALETGASIARKAQVGENTVSRFLRRLGYQGMSGLKDAVRQDKTFDLVGVNERTGRLLKGSLGAALKQEANAVLEIAAQFARQEWDDALTLLAEAGEVYVTGFQMVRGLAQDFTGRASILRDAVRYIDANGGGLSEWLSTPDKCVKRVLVLFDTVPYAREAERVCKIATSRGVRVIVLTDKANDWAYRHTPLVLHASTRKDLFIESAGSLATMSALLLHALAERDPELARDRMGQWVKIVGSLEVF